MAECGTDCGILIRGTMTSEDKPEGQGVREAAAVLPHLLQVHPDLSSEAEEMA
jgi:hypothetical protein